MSDWAILRQEIAAWHAEGRRIPLWWRDDDATAPSAQLDRLMALAQELAMPVHLAIIPQSATPALARLIARSDVLLPVVHGWAHANHALPPHKKSEFGATRSQAQVQSDIEKGHAQMGALLAPCLRSMFVPPWNRFDAQWLPLLVRQGYLAVSTFGSRARPYAFAGLAQVNTHVDPIDWQNRHRLHPAQHIIDHTATLLRKRRSGIYDAEEPLGLLTHHRVHNQAVWAFTRALLSELRQGPVDLWQATR